MSCPECGSTKGHKIACATGNALAMRRQQPKTVDLDALRPVPLAQVIKGPNREWDHDTKAPELFEQWWAKHGDKNWSVKHAPRA